MQERVHLLLALNGPPEYDDEERFGDIPASIADAALFRNSPSLNLVVHVPASCATFPTLDQQQLMHDAGVSAIIAESEGTAATCLPVVRQAAADQLLLADGTRWRWLRGDRASLLNRAAALSESEGFNVAFVASLPVGGAVSEAALRRSSILAWQLHATRGCRAIVLPWSELENAAAATGADGWECVAEQLMRMRRPAWTMVHGG